MAAHEQLGLPIGKMTHRVRLPNLLKEIEFSHKRYDILLYPFEVGKTNGVSLILWETP
jgi:hypothetical protein